MDMVKKKIYLKNNLSSDESGIEITYLFIKKKKKKTLTITENLPLQ
jgi:hypothetical protein